MPALKLELESYRLAVSPVKGRLHCMNYITAKLADVAIGNFTIAGLMDEKGNYYVGVPQITTEFSFLSHNVNRELKALMGKEFSFLKLKTPLNSKVINAIPLKEFEVLLAKLDRKGNLKAQQLRDDLAGLSLTQLFADAFGQQFELEQRQEFLLIRQAGKITRRQLTDSIKDYCDRHPERSDNFRKFVYSNCTDIIYLAFFKKKANQLKEERQCIGDLRSYFTPTELKEVDYRERYAIQLIDTQDIEPIEAVKSAIKFYSHS